ncbi:hypothetical protein BKG85_06090 [Mycobacteroides chelonae]|nr:hypothetical protein BKG85_06090 [Mycobacteroides chelonae]
MHSVHRSRGIFRPKADGLWELHQFENMTCITANGVGGGSLVYGAIQLAPPDSYFDHFPDEITVEEMKPHYVAVHDMLKPQLDPVRHPKTVAFERAAARAGLHAVKQPELAIDFTNHADGTGAAARPCWMGSDDDSKRSLDRTYLIAALERGTRIEALCEATGIAQNPAGGWQVSYRDQRARATRFVEAPCVVLAAGTLGTLRLLFSARDRDKTLPRLGPALGRGFSPNGDMAALAWRAAEPLSSGVGPSVGGYIRDEAGEGRLFITGIGGLPLHALPLPGRMRKRLGESALLFAMGADKIAANVEYDGRELHISASQDDDSELFALERARAECIAKELRPRRFYPNIPFGRSNRLLTVHPLGGARIAATAQSGLVDHTGQVFGYSGLFIADGSQLPAAPGVPPSMTIAALAERQNAHIAAYLGTR